ncbi:MAG: serine hydrolase [Holophagales bacterium]|nr:serine hydrolase [Holophagales bacterium]
MRRGPVAAIAALSAAVPILVSCATAPPRELFVSPPSEPLARRVARHAEASGARMGVVALHVESGRELRWRDTETFEGASIVKLALLVEALARSREGTLELYERWPVPPGAVAAGSGVLDEFGPWLAPTRRDLLRLMMALSDNTSANHFIDAFGAETVNCRMAELGLAGIELVGRIPDLGSPEEDAPWEPLGRMTPRDTAELWRRAATGTLLDRESSHLAMRLAANPRTANRIPRLLASLPGNAWAGKTGTMSGVRADSGVLTTPKGTFVFAIFADRIPGGGSLAANHAMGEIAREVVDAWSKDLPDRPPIDLSEERPRQPALPRVELTPLEARTGGPHLERVYRGADRLFWELWEKAGGDLADACLVPMPNSSWDGWLPRRIEPLTSLVLHHTAMDDDESCIAFFLEPSSFVSSHFLVGRDGRLYQFVSLEHRAFHAGASYLHGRSVLNLSSVGVEITGDGNRVPFTRAQIETVARLTGVLTAQFGLEVPWIAGHEHIAPGRKIDPGALFPWNEVVRRGLALAEELRPLVPPPAE